MRLGRYAKEIRRSAAPAGAGWLAAAGGLLIAAGCQWAADDADREVYRLIEGRQQTALAQTADADLGRERWPEWQKAEKGTTDSPYDFTPHPVDNEVPESFTRAASQPALTATAPADAGPASRPTVAAVTETQPAAPLRILSLADALHYAFRYARPFQTAKEDLYLAALALSLERHLWTPRLVGEIRTRYANYGQIRDFDHAMDVVAEAAVEQRLPFGGEVTARVINSLMRDLTHHLTSGETGRIVLEGNIPLLRGAGRVAYESRYQAERDLIYAVRTFERFRQTFAVAVASDYFDLQQLKQQIENVTQSIASFQLAEDMARARWQTGRVLELEVQRAEQDRLRQMNNRVVAIEQYQTALESFKIRLGMPAETPIDVEPLAEPGTELTPGPTEWSHFSLADTIRMPQVAEPEAVRVGLKYRLDLLNVLDRIDDTRRGVTIAENNLLPGLDAAGSITWDTDPTTLGMTRYEQDRTTYRGAMNLELPLDRKAERNALRTALIDKRRAERDFEEARDEVAVQVRQAMRGVLQQQETLRLQMLSRDLALKRREGAQIRFEQGRVGSRDIVEAENDLLSARNALARAQVQYQLAILRFLRDTGMLRLDDEGRWEELALAPQAEKP